MSTRKWLWALALVASSCKLAAGAEAAATFDAQLQRRAAQLAIPGISYVILRDGKVIHHGDIKTAAGPALTPTTPMRIASVTKVFTAVLLMRAVEGGKLSLDDSASKWLPEFADRPEITVRHLAAHVSEGIPGTEFVYGTQRYAKLGDILRQVYGAQSFEAALRREVIDRAGMAWYDSPGLGAHAALVSTVNDLARFVTALQQHRLASAKSFDTMSTPFLAKDGQRLPVGVGFFSQQIGGERVVWSFGQDDPDYGSALMLLLPKRKLALIVLANSDGLSNPFRLLMGNVRTSPFATAFLDAFAPDLGKAIDARDRAISEVLLAINAGDAPGAVSGLTTIATRFPVSRSDDFALQFAASMLATKLPRGYCEALDTSVVGAHPRNRWALLMSGGMLNELGNNALAVERYQALLALPNQEQDGLARLFRAWSYTGLAAAVKVSDPDGARDYVRQGLATGVTGGTRDGLLQIGRQLGME